MDLPFSQYLDLKILYYSKYYTSVEKYYLLQGGILYNSIYIVLVHVYIYEKSVIWHQIQKSIPFF